MNQILLYGLCVIVAGVFIWRISIAGKGEWKEDFLSLPVSKALLGMFAVLIVLHHIAQTLGNLEMEKGPLVVLEQVGVIFVGMFFFFSGYGLLHSKMSKENYLSGFLKKRLPGILVPFYFCIIIFVAFALIMKLPMSTTEMVAYLCGWCLINTHMWYIVEIAFLYVAFFIIFRFVKNTKVGIALMAAVITGIVVASMLSGHGPECASDMWLQGEWWFNTTYMFLIGMLVAQHENAIVEFAKKYYAVLLLICVLAAVGLFFPTAQMLEEGNYYCEFAPELSVGQIFVIKGKTFLCQFGMVFFAECTILLLMMKVRCQNAVMDFLGKISLELYLIHNLYLMMFAYSGVGNITSSAGMAYAVLFAAIVTACVIHVPIQLIGKIFTRQETVHIEDKKTSPVT